MAPIPPGAPAGIVFRRLDADHERRQAASLLPDCDLDDHDGTCAWYGLCDLTATEAAGPVAVAVLRSLTPSTSRLCRLGTSPDDRGSRLGRRLVREVADRLRASGVEELTAPPGSDALVAGLLGQEGSTADGHSRGRRPGWSSLPL